MYTEKDRQLGRGIQIVKVLGRDSVFLSKKKNTIKTEGKKLSGRIQTVLNVNSESERWDYERWIN